MCVLLPVLLLPKLLLPMLLLPVLTAKCVVFAGHSHGALPVVWEEDLFVFPPPGCAKCPENSAPPQTCVSLHPHSCH